MNLKFPSIPPSVNRFRPYLLSAPVILLLILTPWLNHAVQPLFNLVEDLVEKSILSGDSGRLIWAAAIFVFVRTLVVMPCFWGAFVLGTTLPLPEEPSWLRETVLPVVAAGIVYVLTSAHAGAPWNYLAPLFVLSIGLIFLPGLLGHNFFLPTLVLLQLCLAFFWLDLAPALSAPGFGRGDLPDAIRMAAIFLQDKQVLNMVSISLFLSFFISAAAVAGLTALNINRMAVLRETERREMELERLRMQAAEAQVEKEMLSLVHDLKTPLMTIQGLNSLVAMKVEDAKISEYTHRITQGVDRLNDMISEMLYDEMRKKVTVDQLIDYVRAHVVARITTRGTIKFDIAPDLPALQINFIRVVRALINLIENAIAAINAKDGGVIQIRAGRDATGGVILVVADNGVGIDPDELEHVWECGFSGNRSSGLGLDFVRRVVENNGGRIELIGEPDRGTMVTITFPGVKNDDQDSGH